MLKQEQSVLIVGAGPSGLMLAHELARFKISVRLIDKALIKSSYSRAIAVQIRTLEIMSALGLLKALEAKSQSLGAIEIYAENRPPLKIKPSQTNSNFIRPLIIDQVHTEEVLEQRVRELGVNIERGVELINLEMLEDGVYAELKSAQHIEKTGPFAYIIGADGAHSLVRKKMATSFLGSTYEDAFILADALCQIDADEKKAFRLFFKNRDFLAMIPMYGPGHYRLISVRKNERADNLEPTAQEFQDLVAKLAPFEVKLKKVSWLSRFFVQCRSSSRYEEGRLFLIGDAAHLHSPAGGQGMNTGLQDAFNLGFKLALVIKNIGSKNILLSYEDERKPVGEFLTKNTDRFFKFMVKGSLFVRLLRRFILPYCAHHEEFRSRIFRLASQTAIRYKKGLLCNRHKHSKIQEIEIGVRMPNFSLINNFYKTDIHTQASLNYFSCFIFVRADYIHKKLQEIYEKAENLAEKFNKFLRVFMIFSSNADTAKIKSKKLDYLFLENKKISEAFYVITRTDAHVFCVAKIEDLSHAEQALSLWYMENIYD